MPAQRGRERVRRALYPFRRRLLRVTACFATLLGATKAYCGEFWRIYLNTKSGEESAPPFFIIISKSSFVTRFFLGSIVLLFSNRDLGAAFTATCLGDLLATRGLCSREKAMSFGSFSSVWLVCLRHMATIS